MTTKSFNGKAIYQPKNKAAEYSAWACNFYVGCSNGCTYCYCKKGILAGAMGQDKPQLKKCFKDEDHAMRMFVKELRENIDELRKHGLFFSFSTDPMLPETIKLTQRALNFCHIPFEEPIPVKILTKCAWWVDGFLNDYKRIFGMDYPDKIAFGFTLTGHDELEPNASTNAERIEAMKKLHDAGFKTWASIEPIIDFYSAATMIGFSKHWCDLFKIGLMSGGKYFKPELRGFIESTNEKVNVPIYWKDSLLKAAGISRESLPATCVTRDFNIFNQ
jgi:DNA repair photolyase